MLQSALIPFASIIHVTARFPNNILVHWNGSGSMISIRKQRTPAFSISKESLEAEKALL